jgi:glycosyltransferase involved in cell wall biosynthesis
VYAGALTYHANYDAAQYLLADIYPRLAAKVPGLTLRVTGGTRGVDLDALPTHPGVHYTGYVPDIRPVVARSWVSVVPLRVGGGTRLKILESMALGTPVVSTSKGAEGLEVTHGENILIADDPRDFADSVTEVLQSPALRARLASGGRRLVETTYAWDIVGPRLRALVEQVTACPAVH